MLRSLFDPKFMFSVMIYSKFSCQDYKWCSDDSKSKYMIYIPDYASVQYVPSTVLKDDTIVVNALPSITREINKRLSKLDNGSYSFLRRRGLNVSAEFPISSTGKHNQHSANKDIITKTHIAREVMKYVLNLDVNRISHSVTWMLQSCLVNSFTF